MHQTITSRKAIYIPHTVDVIPLDELASRLAAALFQLKEAAEGVTQDMEADATWYAHAKATDRFRHGLIKACEAGQLAARDNIAHMQCSPEEKGALLLVDGGDGEALFVNVIAFDTGPCTALLALGDGDSVALVGTLTPKAWLDREGQPRAAVDVVAAQVLSAYHVRRKREAVTTPKPCTTPAAAVAQMEQAFGAAGQWDDGGTL